MVRPEDNSECSARLCNPSPALPIDRFPSLASSPHEFRSNDRQSSQRAGRHDVRDLAPAARATGNHKDNESVWVQFSDARSAGGSRVYALRSTSGLLVNLEPCNECGVSDWGWQKGAWWLRQATSVTFAASGRHIIRVQVREDGAQIDQIVLSPSRYLRTPPGTARVDTTIVDTP
jgi:hypothetical protein